MTQHESNRVVVDVLRERQRQDEKWGTQDHDYPRWRVILGEELGEADRAYLDAADSRNHRAELVQCAAVLVAMIECGDRNARWPSPATGGQS